MAFPGRKLLTLWLLVLLTTMSLGACLESNQRVAQIFPLFIQPMDLPSGWYYDTTGAGIGRLDNERQGVISRYRTYRGTRDRDLLEVHVSQEIILFPDADQAARSFSAIVEEEVPTKDWGWPEQVRFESEADQFLLVCLDLRAVLADAEKRHRETHWCRSIGRYGAVVSIIWANVFEDKWLTFEDFQNLLTMADTRLTGAANLEPP
jgi:hypothetical protein